MRFEIKLALMAMALLAACLSEPASAPTQPWQVLFDGTTVSGLRGFRETGFPADCWEVVDGTLQANPGRSVDLVTDEQFRDFELEFEWKVPPGGNSGVMYRVTEAGSDSLATYMSGPEYQVLDDDLHPDGKDPRTSAGSLFGLIAPQGKSLKPVGEFNQGRIVLRDNHVEHWLNGTRVLTYEWYSPEIQERIANSKFKAWPEFMRQETGHIAFQHHGEEVWFRNIRVRRLNP